MIQAKNLTKYYGSHCAVDNISFTVPKGEILGLLGPNGAGKTTTMRMVTGFLRPTSGSISIADRSIAEESLESKRLVGYLPEFAPLYAEMMVYNYLRYVARVRQVDESRIPDEIRRVAELCGLTDVMHQAFQELSRGYRQRVGLAHAIIGDPEILIFDEPTSGLDPNQIVEIRSLIKNIGKEKTVIFSTHVLSEAEATCDRIVIIHRGRIVSDSTPSALRQSLKGGSMVQITLENATYEAVESALSPLNGVVEVTNAGARRLSERGPSERGTAEENIVQIRVSCDEEARRSVYRRIKSEDWILLELKVERQSMEDAFRELTEHNELKGKIDGR